MDFYIFTAPSIHGKEGTIEIDGIVFDIDKGWNSDLIPKGTYGIRWSDPYWFWAKDGQPVATLPSDHSPAVEAYWKSLGVPPVRQYTFKDGPLGEGNKSPYFDFPLAGDSNEAPWSELANTLVVQVTEPDQVEFLGATEVPAGPFPLPPDWGAVKEIEAWDPCQETPEFCEPIPVPGSKGVLCLELGWFELCPKKEETSMGLVRVRDLSAAVARHLLAARTFAGADGRGEAGADARAALRAARERVRCAQRYGSELGRARSALLDVLRRNARTPHSMRFAARMSLQVELGLRAIDRCAARLDGSPEGGLDAILRDARLAHRSFGTALIQFQRLETWALPAELKSRRGEPR